MRDLLDEISRRLDGWHATVGAAGAGTATAPLDAPAGSRLAALERALPLTPLEAGLLAVAVGPELDPALAARFAALDQPPGRGQARADIAVWLAGGAWSDPEVHEALSPRGTLIRAGLLSVAPLAGQPLLHAALMTHERVAGHLAGSDAPEAIVVHAAATVAQVSTPEVASVAGALREGYWSVWLAAPRGGGASVAASAFAALGVPVVAIDLTAVDATAREDLLAAAVREAALIGGALAVTGVAEPRATKGLVELLADPVRPVVVAGPAAWDAGEPAVRPVEVTVVQLDLADRAAVWADTVRAAGTDAEAVAATVGELPALRLAPEQIVAAVASASAATAAESRPLDEPALRAAALRHSAGLLGSLAQRIVPTATLDDLVLPNELRAEIASIASRYRTIDAVRDWNILRANRGRGVTCLFAGSSGTGKTLAAEAVAHLLGVDLFLIDLSQVVDKYIGETEKNLDRIFTQAERLNGVLLFDEADALFGKRSAVQDAHDRHANVETAYLLQRMEHFDGVAVLTTNLRGNLDEAFTRRIDVICSFPDPDVAERAELWRKHLPSALPVSGGIDIELLATTLPVAGGVIRNIAVSAAHAAAAAGGPVTMDTIVTAVAREYRKMGRLFDGSPLGQ